MPERLVVAEDRGGRRRPATLVVVVVARDVPDRLDRAVLVRSKLTPDGPIYEPIETVRLTADP